MRRRSNPKQDSAGPTGPFATSTLLVLDQELGDSICLVGSDPFARKNHGTVMRVEVVLSIRDRPCNGTQQISWLQEFGAGLPTLLWRQFPHPLLLRLLLEPIRSARKTDVISQPLKHYVVLPDLQNAEALLDSENPASRWLGQALVNERHRLGDLVLRLQVRGIVAAYDNSLYVDDIRNVDHGLLDGRLLLSDVRLL